MEAVLQPTEHPDPRLQLAAIEARIEHLKSLRQTQLQGQALGALSKETARARRDALIYFHVVQFGHGWRRIDGQMNVRSFADAPVSKERRLGYPGRGLVWRAGPRIRQLCPEETKTYEQQFVYLEEAQRRYKATLTDESWRRYVGLNEGASLEALQDWWREREFPNVELSEPIFRTQKDRGGRSEPTRSNTVLYHSEIDLWREGGDIHFKVPNRANSLRRDGVTQTWFRYRLTELKPKRHLERARAKREAEAAQAIMSEMRKRIFDALGVPEFARSLA